jgi:hypothetical protein
MVIFQCADDDNDDDAWESMVVERNAKCEILAHSRGIGIGHFASSSYGDTVHATVPRSGTRHARSLDSTTLHGTTFDSRIQRQQPPTTCVFQNKIMGSHTHAHGIGCQTMYQSPHHRSGSSYVGLPFWVNLMLHCIALECLALSGFPMRRTPTRSIIAHERSPWVCLYPTENSVSTGTPALPVLYSPSRGSATSMLLLEEEFFHFFMIL